MRIAVLDLGSNSFLLYIAEKQGDAIKVLHDESVVTRLGQGVHQSKKFHPEALKRAEQCFKNFKVTIDRLKVDKVIAVSTSAARDAENKQEFLLLGKKYNIPIEIISGSKEAKLTFIGSTYDFSHQDQLVVIDVGGGSTEIIGVNDDGEIQGWSLDIGAVRLTEMFISSQPINAENIKQAKAHIKHQFQQHLSVLPKKILTAVAVAGTPTTLACLINQEEFTAKLDQQKITLHELEKWFEKLIALSVDERSKLPGMQAGREDILPMGILILIETLKHFDLQQLLVSIKGVRYGIAREML